MSSPQIDWCIKTMDELSNYFYTPSDRGVTSVDRDIDALVGYVQDTVSKIMNGQANLDDKFVENPLLEYANIRNRKWESMSNRDATEEQFRLIRQLHSELKN